MTKMIETLKKLSQAAARPVWVIIILNIRICLDFGASDWNLAPARPG
jgi:hypothetical protein